MEDIDQINNINRCATRISGEGGKDLYGSGILYVGGSKESAFIFTAAHVIREIWKRKKSQEIQRLHFTMKDGKDKCKIIEFDCEIVSNNDGKEHHGDIYIHEKYNDKSYTNDVAIICIPREDWMNSLLPFRIKESENMEKQKGYGFPKSSDGESEKEDQSELAGKLGIKGEVINKDNKKYCFEYKKDVKVEDANRDNIMSGFSGSGLFAEKNGSYILCGIASSPCGEESSGNVMWVSEATLLFEVMKQQKISPQLPQSFNDYKNSIIDREFDIGFEYEKDLFHNIADELINEKGLVPSIVFENDFKEIRCDRGRLDCDKYWEGQLKKAVILSESRNIKVDNMKNPKITMPNPYENDIVQIKFLCTDEKFEKVITDLIKKDFFSNGIITDKTIFLWNGSEIENYSRRRMRRVIPQIADLERKEYSPKILYKKFSELLPKSEKYSKFDIIKGSLANCNLAIIATEEMMKSLKSSDGEPEKMKRQFEEKIKRIWEV